MLDGAIIIPLQSLFWNLLFELGALLWVVGRALLNVGYFIMVLTGWVSQNIFAPLLDAVNNQRVCWWVPLFVIAMTVLGFTYMLAVFGRFNVVSMRSAVIVALVCGGDCIPLDLPSIWAWKIFVALRAVVSMKQVSPLSTGAGTATGLGAIGTMPADIIATPTDQFGMFLPSVPGASAVDGLDVAMVYVLADGLRCAGGFRLSASRLPVCL
jgi:hypothetical protein